MGPVSSENAQVRRTAELGRAPVGDVDQAVSAESDFMVT